MDGWLTVVVAIVVGWLTRRVAREEAGLCCWLEPVEPCLVDCSGPKSRRSRGSGGLSLSLSSKEDIERSGISLKITEINGEVLIHLISPNATSNMAVCVRFKTATDLTFLRNLYNCTTRP